MKHAIMLAILLAAPCLAAVAGDARAQVDATGLLEARIDLPLGPAPRGLCVLDLDGDGDEDLLVLEKAGFRIFRHNPPDLPERGELLPCEAPPLRAWTCELDDAGGEALILAGDERLLLLPPGDQEAALRNGSWKAAAPIEGIQGVQAMCNADWMGDGSANLIVADAGGERLMIGRLRSGGAFESLMERELADRADALAAGDGNGDGKPDLFVASRRQGSVTVLINGPGGALEDGAVITVDPEPFSLAAADFDEDGRLDLACGFKQGNSVRILFGGGQGAFARAASCVAGRIPAAVEAADLDGDRNTDLVVLNEYSENVSLCLGRGDGGFAVARNYPAGDGPTSLATAHMNSDAAIDLVTADLFGESVSVLLGGAAGNFRLAGSTATGAPSWSVAAADFNADGLVDVVAAHCDSNRLSLLAGSGGGGLKKIGSIPMGDGPWELLPFEANGDHSMDLLAANRASDTVALLAGRGDGSFAEPVGGRTGKTPSSLVAGDFDEDGRRDLAVFCRDDGTLSLLHGKGDGTFRPGKTLPAGFGPRAAAADDLDGDGHLDLAVADFLGGRVLILKGDGKGDFRELDSPGIGSLLPDSCLIGNTDCSQGIRPRALAPGDFNHDGRRDLAVADFHGGNVFLLLGRGDGSFVRDRAYGVGNTPIALAAGDFNGDGLDDVVTANYHSDDVSVLLGRGAGGAAAQTLAQPAPPTGSPRAWERIEGPPGGAVYAFLASAARDSILAAVCGGGIYRSLDGGRSWAMISGALASQWVRCLARDESGLLFAGTSLGVFQSRDEGKSWEQGRQREAQVRVWDLLTLPGSELLAAADQGILLSRDRGESWEKVAGLDATLSVRCLCRVDESGEILLAGASDGSLLRSTDKGRGWDQLEGAWGKAAVTDLLVDAAAKRVLAATVSGIYQSADEGLTWHGAWPELGGKHVMALFSEPDKGLLAAGIDGRGIAWLKEEERPQYRGMGLEDARVRDLIFLPDGDLLAATEDGVARSADAGATWTPSSEGLGAASVWWIEEVPWGGGRRLYTGSSAGVHYSDERKMPRWIFAGPDSSRADVWCLLFDAKSRRLFAGSDDGVHRSEDGGATWVRGTDAVGNPRVNMLAEFSDGTLLAAASGQGNGVYLGEAGGDAWRGPLPGTEGQDVYGLIVQPGSDQVALAGTYAASILKTEDGGASWRWVWQESSMGVKAFALDRGNPHSVFAAVSGGGVLSSRDFGESWERLSGPPSPNMRSIVAGREAGTLYVGTVDYGVILGMDAGDRWAPLGGSLSNPFVWHVHFDPVDGQVWASTFGGGIYRFTLP